MARINYKNYPTIGIMGNDIDKFNIKIYQDDSDSVKKNPDKILEITKETLKNKTKITSVSKKFIDAVIHSYDKISNIINKDVNDEFRCISINETFIIGGFIIHTVQRISPFEFYIKTSVFEKDGYLVGAFEQKKIGSDFFIWETVTNDNIYQIDGIRYNLPVFFSKIIPNIIYFKKYAEVEIVESKSKSKKVVFGCKYLNETNSDIEYLDSKWFTTLINKNGFKVRGFFRLQPKKKDGEWVKELVWINEFEKKGYKRQSIIKQNEQTI